jgi:23S rRNA (uracil1939-C5)-methyltransferase
LVERLAIDGLGARGDGISSSEAGAIYVPYTLPGEVVEVDPWPGHPDRRNLLRVEAASAARITPICPHFGVCGGCQLQHWDAAPYLAWKREAVVTALRHGRRRHPRCSRRRPPPRRPPCAARHPRHP